MVEASEVPTVVYGYWRDDVEKKPGHSRELM